MAWSLCSDTAWIEDLVQEGSVFLWKSGVRDPGGDAAWHVALCEGFLRNHLRRGRSLDSFRRRHLRCGIPDEDLPTPDWLQGQSFLAELCERDCLAVLSARLDKTDAKILRLAGDGLTEAEIAAEIAISQQAVSRRRKRIAACAIQIGLTPLASRSARLRTTSVPSQ